MSFFVDVRLEPPAWDNDYSPVGAVRLVAQDGSRQPFQLTACEAEALASKLMQAAKECRIQESAWAVVRPFLRDLPHEAVLVMRSMDSPSRVALAKAIKGHEEVVLEEVDPMGSSPWQAALESDQRICLGFFSHPEEAVSAMSKLGLSLHLG